MQKAFQPEKINYGAYSDKLSHLHFHLAPKYVDGPDYGGIFQMNPGNVYLTDIGNLRVRKIASDGTVTEMAGTGTADDVDWGINWRYDNGGTGSYNAVVRPTDLKVDNKGNMYICDDWTGAQYEVKRRYFAQRLERLCR